MNKRLLLVILAVVVVLGILVFAFLTNSGRQQAEDSLRSQNSRFHTVKEGDFCRADMGDCVGGLTCADNLCQKP